MSYAFKDDWFSKNAREWVNIVLTLQPGKYLEIGSHEGRSVCALIEQTQVDKDLEVICIDPWPDADAEGRFDANIAVALASKPRCAVRKIKGLSAQEMPKLLAQGDKYDLIYIDGSHSAPDVLCDAVMAFCLCRVGGMIVLDDYLWPQNQLTDLESVSTAKVAIDAFVNCYRSKLKLLPMVPLWQFYVLKYKD